MVVGQNNVTTMGEAELGVLGFDHVNQFCIIHRKGLTQVVGLWLASDQMRWCPIPYGLKMKFTPFDPAIHRLPDGVKLPEEVKS